MPGFVSLKDQGFFEKHALAGQGVADAFRGFAYAKEKKQQLEKEKREEERQKRLDLLHETQVNAQIDENKLRAKQTGEKHGWESQDRARTEAIRGLNPMAFQIQPPGEGPPMPPEMGSVNPAKPFSAQPDAVREAYIREAISKGISPIEATSVFNQTSQAMTGVPNIPQIPGMRVKSMGSDGGVSYERDTPTIPDVKTVQTPYGPMFFDQTGNQLSAPKTNDGLKELVTSEADSIAMFDNAKQQVQLLDEMFNNYQGFNGPVAGMLSSKNPFSVEAAKVTQQVEGLLPVVARGIMGEKGVLTDSDIARVRSQLPSISDTDEVRKAKIAGLKTRIDMMRKTTVENLGRAKRDLSGYQGGIGPVSPPPSAIQPPGSPPPAPAAGPSSPTPVNSQAEYDALPPGAWYQDSAGNVAQKKR